MGKLIRALMVTISICAIVIVFRNEYRKIDHESKVMSGFRFIETLDGIPIEFKAFQASRDGVYYVILPNLFQKEKACFEILYSDPIYEIYIDGKCYQNNDVWEDDLTEQIHTIQIKDFFGNVKMDKKLQVLKSGELPVMMVTVEAKDALYENTDYDNKNYVETGKMLYFDENGVLQLDTSLEVFKVRGNSTANLPKKPFKITLAEPFSFCGMEPAVNWNLLANMKDGSNVRNKIILDWAQEVLDTYQADSEYIELFLNGEYQGLYLLTETIEMGENRLDYAEDGLLVEMELDYNVKEGTPSVLTNEGHTFIVHSEEYVTESELEEIALYLNEIESALYSPDGVGKQNGKKLAEMIDIDSWTDMWLFREISADHDMGTISQFAYVENWSEKGILIGGPAWDFDCTFGNGMVPLYRNPRSLVAAMIDTKGIESTNQNRWLAPMYQNDEFYELLVSKFENEYYDKMSQLVEYQIDVYGEYIWRSALLDSLRWNGDGHWDYMYAPEGFSIPSEGDYTKYDVQDIHFQMVKDFISEKQLFLKELWIDNVEFEVQVEEHYEKGMALELNNNIYTWIKKED